MEFDWLDVHFDLKKVTPREIEESFEDPFAIRMIPDQELSDSDARYICLAKTVGGRPLFSVFWTDGKNCRVIFVREMDDKELGFYDRKNADYI